MSGGMDAFQVASGGCAGAKDADSGNACAPSVINRVACQNHELASKRGIIITAVILAAITAASFIAWMLPQENPSTFVVTDHEGYLDGVKKIHEVLEESIEIEFQDMIGGSITPDQYAAATQATTSQVTAQITEFVKSKPPQEWQESYISYMEALKKFNSYVVETRIVASLVSEGGEELEQAVQRAQELKTEYRQMVELSDQSRP